ncbi:MAG: MFS transporter [Alphaproteobacteria bacterium]|nr:MFS transporter [Alphaproteobacteria bacterium]MCB9928367.1 MFS transporter [Alphaproteobacteria bacterium]
MSDERPPRPSARSGSRRPAPASSARRPTRPPEAPSPRAAAGRTLYHVLDRRRPLEEAMAEDPAWGKLHGRDRAFARLLVTTVLRRLGQIDDAVGRFVQRQPEGRDAYVRHVLRLAAAQLLFLDTPPHAAVDQATRMTRGPGMKSMVNAVLRRLVEARGTVLREQDADRLNLPDWLWRSWCEAYGEAATRAIVRAQMQDPPLDITLRAGQDLTVWAERLQGRVLPTGTIRIAKTTHVPNLFGYGQGVWWVQDAAAALPARLMGDVHGKSVVDLAAAPGGKTLQLAAAGAQVMAVDQSRERLERLFENLERTNLSADTDVADGRYWRPRSPVDAVLLDAPCSTTGTARRHPDVLWNKTPEAIASLTQVQDALLKNAAGMVKPGGLLVYACCSLQPEEGPKRIEAFLRRHPAWGRQPVGAGEIPGCAEFVTANGDLRTLPSHWPGQGGIDGFYIARLVHRGAT